MIKDGYEKTRPCLFKIATFRTWRVLVSGPELIEDVKKAPDDLLSRVEPRCDILQQEYTLDLPNDDDFYHSDVIRSKLIRNVSITFKEVHEELIHTLEDLIPTVEDNWVKVPIVETLQRVICSATNRVFVGVPLCRNRDYQELNLTFAVNVIKHAMIISFFPKPLKSIVAHMLSNVQFHIRQEMGFIKPIVEERSARMEEFGDDWDKPNDMLTWLMSEAKGAERSLKGLARRLLVLNFSAVHSTAQTVTQVLYRLLSHPEHIEPLRKEVEAVVAEEGWTKTGMEKMHKIDSFVRETLRMDGQSIITTTRLTLRPFTFSNGVTIPEGTLISLPTRATHKDEILYENPNEFDGFRFAKPRESEGDAVTNRHRLISTSATNLSWGLGRHSCPGRLFARRLWTRVRW